MIKVFEAVVNTVSNTVTNTVYDDSDQGLGDNPLPTQDYIVSLAENYFVSTEDNYI